MKTAGPPKTPPRGVALACCLLALVMASGAAAQDDDDQLRELKQLEAEIEARRKEESRLKDEAAARAREVKALRNNMVETANALQDAERRIAAINTQLADLEQEESAAEEALREQQSNLSDVLAALQSFERSRPPALLVSPGDAAAAARAAMLLADAAPALDKRAGDLRAALERLGAVREKLSAERATFERTNDEIMSRRKVLAELLQDKQRARDVALEMAKAAQSETAALAARATTLREVLARLDRLAQSIVPRLKPPFRLEPSGAPTPSLARKRRRPAEPFQPAAPFAEARGQLRPPIVGDIVGAFGDAQSDGPRAGGGQRSRLEGLRFRAAANAIVTAPYEGNVVFARFYEPTGNLIVLDVGDGYHILLMGVGSFLVDEGQTVAAGEPIAVMPTTGGQLDFEIRRRREPVNPALWLSAKLGG